MIFLFDTYKNQNLKKQQSDRLAAVTSLPVNACNNRQKKKTACHFVFLSYGAGEYRLAACDEKDFPDFTQLVEGPSATQGAL